MAYKNKDVRDRKHREYMSLHKDRVNAQRRKRLAADSELRERARVCTRRWRNGNPQSARDSARRARRKTRQAILTMYGDRCACCGDDHEEFLALDHVNGGGAKHRKSVGTTSSTAVYRSVLNEGYHPERYRILCHNCNMALALYGYCPHDRPEMADEKDFAICIDHDPERNRQCSGPKGKTPQ